LRLDIKRNFIAILIDKHWKRLPEKALEWSGCKLEEQHWLNQNSSIHLDLHPGGLEAFPDHTLLCSFSAPQRRRRRVSVGYISPPSGSSNSGRHRRGIREQAMPQSMPCSCLFKTTSPMVGASGRHLNS